jgi:hypothetical protein
MGLSGGEVESNITDNENDRIKGPHGYIQGYNGITGFRQPNAGKRLSVLLFNIPINLATASFDGIIATIYI